MKTRTSRRFFNFLIIVAVIGVLFAQIQAATVSPKLQKQLTRLADNASVGTAIVAFNTTNGLQESHLNILRSVGITSGKTFPTLGMVAMTLTRAPGHDADARALAGSTKTFQNQALSDNAQIPAALRGYVQIAINNGLFEAFPAEVKQIAPGQFQVFPGPRFEPNTTVNRAALATKLNSFRQLFTTGN